MGNPDVKPEKTVQYEFGYKQALTRGPRRRPHRLLQGHPRPARRRVHRDLQRRRVRAAHQRRLRQRDRLHPGARPPADCGPVSTVARLHLAAGAGQLERPARDGHARRGRRGSAAAPDSVQLGPAPHAQPDRLWPTPSDYTASADLARGQRPAVHAGRSTPASAAGWRRTPGASRPAMVVDLRAEKLLTFDGSRHESLRAGLQPVRHPLLQRRGVRQHRQPLLLALPGRRTPWRSPDPTRFYPPRRIEIGFRLGSEL